MLAFITKSFLGHFTSKNHRNFSPAAGIHWLIKLPELGITIVNFIRPPIFRLMLFDMFTLQENVVNCLNFPKIFRGSASRLH